MKFLVFLVIILGITFQAFSQQLETVGAGVIDFLLTNPRTANRMNETEAAAFNVIGNLLTTSANRQHQMNVANASQAQVEQKVILNDISGRQAEIVLDLEGKMHVVFNGVAYPLNNGVVEEAKEEFVPINAFDNEYLPPYDIEEIKRNFSFNKPLNHESISKTRYKVENVYGEYLSDIVKKINVSMDDIYLVYYDGRDKPKKRMQEWKSGAKKVKFGTIFRYYNVTPLYDDDISFSLTCKWVMDFNEDGIEFEDCQGVKNSFTNDENITIVSGYQVNNPGEYSLEIFEFETGNLLFRRSGKTSAGEGIFLEIINPDVLNPGSYVYSAKLYNGEEFLSSKQERFEIRN